MLITRLDPDVPLPSYARQDDAGADLVCAEDVDLQAHVEGEDRVTLVIDRRLAGEFSVEEAERVVPFVANAIAVAMGYGAYLREDTPRPFARAPYPRPERVVDLFALPDA